MAFRHSSHILHFPTNLFLNITIDLNTCFLLCISGGRIFVKALAEIEPDPRFPWAGVGPYLSSLSSVSSSSRTFFSSTARPAEGRDGVSMSTTRDFSSFSWREPNRGRTSVLQRGRDSPYVPSTGWLGSVCRLGSAQFKYFEFNFNKNKFSSELPLLGPRWQFVKTCETTFK